MSTVRKKKKKTVQALGVSEWNIFHSMRCFMPLIRTPPSHRQMSHNGSMDQEPEQEVKRLILHFSVHYFLTNATAGNHEDFKRKRRQRENECERQVSSTKETFSIQQKVR